MNYAMQYVETILELHKGQVSEGHARSEGVKVYQAFMQSAKAFTTSDIDVETSGKLAGQFNCQSRMCFQNSLRIAKKLNNYRYFEGFATCLIPVEHAWLVDERGKVVDPTWYRFVGTEHPPVDYYGVEVPWKEAQRNRRRSTWEPSWVRFLQKEEPV